MHDKSVTSYGDQPADEAVGASLPDRAAAPRRRCRLNKNITAAPSPSQEAPTHEGGDADERTELGIAQLPMRLEQ